jgi:hypothetical protein
MPQRSRPCRLQVKLDRDEYAALIAKATELGVSRSTLVRDAIRTYGKTATRDLTRAQALELLGTAARDGSVPAQIAFERALRLAPLQTEPPHEQPAEGDELTRWRRRHEVGP